MRSVPRSAAPSAPRSTPQDEHSPAPPDDLTARARIRDAALARFARDGFRASLRTIAADAGVSAGLVIHHFGSKDALRQELDDYVLAHIRARNEDFAVNTTGPLGFFGQLAMLDEYASEFGYLVRSLQAGGDLARSLIDHLTADAVEYIRVGVEAGTFVPSRDEPARARYLAMLSMGTLLLDLTLNPPPEPFDPSSMVRDYLDRTALPSLELFTEGFLTDSATLTTYLEYRDTENAAQATTQEAQ